MCVCVRERERERERFKLCMRGIQVCVREEFLVVWQIKFKMKFSLSWSTSSILGHFVTFWFILLKFVQLQDFGWNFLTTFGNFLKSLGNFLTLLGNFSNLWGTL